MAVTVTIPWVSMQVCSPLAECRHRRPPIQTIITPTISIQILSVRLALMMQDSMKISSLLVLSMRMMKTMKRRRELAIRRGQMAEPRR